jgi:hypothetical protein
MHGPLQALRIPWFRPTAMMRNSERSPPPAALPSHHHCPLGWLGENAAMSPHSL